MVCKNSVNKTLKVMDGMGVIPTWRDTFHKLNPKVHDFYSSVNDSAIIMANLGIMNYSQYHKFAFNISSGKSPFYLNSTIIKRTDDGFEVKSYSEKVQKIVEDTLSSIKMDFSEQELSDVIFGITASEQSAFYLDFCHRVIKTLSKSVNSLNVHQQKTALNLEMRRFVNERGPIWASWINDNTIKIQEDGIVPFSKMNLSGELSGNENGKSGFYYFNMTSADRKMNILKLRELNGDNPYHVDSVPSALG